MFDSAYWGERLFNYCERGADPGFWAEPLNALSNICFIAAALAGGLRLARHRHVGGHVGGHVDVGAGGRAVQQARLLLAGGLVGLAGLIGIGSFLFHTFATRWAQLGDIVPIGLFMFAYMGFVLRYLGGWSPAMSSLAVAIFAVISLKASAITCTGGGSCLNGSIAYLPALAGLVIAGLVLRRRGDGSASWLLGAGAIFAISLLFRTVDMLLCDEVQISGYFSGTHFLWHMFNGLMLYMLLAAAIDALAGESKIAGS